VPDDRWTPLRVHALLLAPIFVAAWLELSPTALLLMGGTLVSIGYPLLFVMETRRAPLLLSPLSYQFVWSWLSLGLAAIWKGWDAANGVKAFTFATGVVSIDDVATGYAIYLGGFLALHAGITVFRPLVRPSPDGPDTGTAIQGLGILWAIGIAARLPLPSLGAITGVLAPASTAALCALALGPVRGGRSKVAWSLLAVGMGIEFVLGTAFNSKGLAMLALLPLLWLALCSRRRVVNLAVLVAAMAVLYLAVVVPINTALRTSRGREQDFGPYSASAMQGAVQEPADASWLERSDLLLERLFDPMPVSYFVSEARLFGFQGGRTMAYTVYGLVPRIFWPEKPSTSQGAAFAAYVGLAPSAEEATTSLGQTAVGELYWNFGLSGVLLGMALLGILYGRLWTMAGANPLGDPVRWLLYVGLILGIPDQPAAGSMALGLLYRLVVFGGILKLTAHLRRPRIRPASVNGAA
jgi:hypothetical protein